MNRMLKSMSRPNIAAPGEAFSSVWYVEQMAHTLGHIELSCA